MNGRVDCSMHLKGDWLFVPEHCRPLTHDDSRINKAVERFWHPFGFHCISAPITFQVQSRDAFPMLPKKKEEKKKVKKRGNCRLLNYTARD